MSSTTDMKIPKGTVNVHKPTIEALKQSRMDPDETLENVILRLLSSEGRVFVDVIAVDGEYARKSQHEVIFQVGNKPARYYTYKQGNLIPVDKLPIRVQMQHEGVIQ